MKTYYRFQAAEDASAFPPKNHYHGDYEVYCLTGGRCRYFIGTKTYSMHPGDTVLIPPGVIHKVIYETSTHSRSLINCTLDYIPPSARTPLEGASFFPGRSESAQALGDLLRKMKDANVASDSFREDTLRCLTMELFLLLARQAEQETPSDVVSFVEKAVNHIQSRYAHKVTLSETAHYCAVSPEHLSRSFKRETGFHFSEYLNLYRLKKAETMLCAQPGKSISQVAMACGFPDSNYFSAVYKKYHGITPSQTRSAQKSLSKSPE